MRSAVYSGSFDPFTNGHLDVLKKACALFDTVYVAVLNNTSKRTAFTPEERKSLIETVIADNGLKNAQAVTFEGLLVDLMRELNASYIVRGLRSPADYDYEAQMERANRHLMPKAQTVYFSADAEHSFISSTIVREMARYDADLTQFVPREIITDVKNKLQSRR